MKKISAALICAALICAIGACEKDDARNSDYTAKEIADAVMAAYGPESLPESGFEYFYSGADEESDNYIDDKYAGYLIDGGYSPLEEYGHFSDCALYIPVGQHMFEVGVLKVAPGDEKNIAVLKDVFERRLKTKANSDILAYTPGDAPIIENAKVLTVGNYVILLATTDNAKAQKVIDDMTKQ